MTLKIVSDGTRSGTMIVNAETGELLENVTAVIWSYDANECCSHCKLSILNVEMDVIAEDPTKRVDPANQKRLKLDVANSLGLDKGVSNP